MAKRSDEAKKDLKIKITVAVIVALIVGPLLLIGPGLPSVIEDAKKRKAEPGMAERLLLCAQIMDNTFREDQAQALYDQLYLMYGGNDWEEDFDAVLEDTGEDEDQAFYIPWVVKDYDGLPGEDMDDPDIVNRRPAPVSPTRHAIFGKVMIAKAKYFEERRLYDQSKHLWRCLFHMWPSGSPEHAEGKAAYVRAASRSF